jgi:hypothetical protein
MPDQIITKRKPACHCITKEMKHNIAYNSKQGGWHSLPQGLKPNLEMNANGISHDVSCNRINTGVKVKELPA